MKRFLLLLLAVFFGNLASGQDLQWAKRQGGTGLAKGFSLALDGSGNIYTTGRFTETMDFDPGPGVFNLTSAGAFDIFISKSDAAGNFLWAKRIGGIATDWGVSIAVQASGELYICGDFGGTVDFDPGPGVLNLTSYSPLSFFTMKMDAGGNFIWAHTVQTTPGYIISNGTAVTLDADGNIYTTGTFQGTVDFDPGPGVAQLVSNGFTDSYILKMDAAGHFLWVKSFGSVLNTETSAVTTDPAGNICMTGSYNATTDFDPGEGTFELTPFGELNIFILKLDASGNFLWVKSINGYAVNERGNAIATDTDGNIYTTGQFGETADFDPGPAASFLTSKGGGDIFISKLDPDGNFIWARSVGGPSPDLGDIGHSIALDPAGNIYTTGYFFGTADFDPGPGTVELSSAGGLQTPDIFILKLDAAGNFGYARRLGGTGYDQGASIAADAAGNVYTTGYFTGTVDFDPGAGVYNLVSTGEQDAFILKLGPGALPLNLLEFNGRLLNGSGVLSWKTDQERNLAGFEVERSIDGRNYKSVGGVSAVNNSGVHSYAFTDPGIHRLGTNVIYYRLRQKNLSGGYSFSRIIALAVDGKNTLRLYPNPVRTTAAMIVTIDKGSPVMARVTDDNGRLVQQQQWNLPAGSSSLSLDLSKLPKGIYLLSLTGAAIHENKKFSKE